ncbi:DNA photolyase, N-terminal [Dillenia turbinata]|uniref:DNA photolyase, N-terminal n=1 Tax=Dillenia turbinata TaxID=194707 RepID=A0AAN8VV46_9MAGN
MLSSSLLTVPQSQFSSFLDFLLSTPSNALLSLTNPIPFLSSICINVVFGDRREENEKKNNGLALLWFKRDLRMDDHPGQLAASHYRIVLPLYIFDRRILPRYSDDMLELVLFAIEDLGKSLKEQGSNQMIRFGTAENVVERILKEVKGTAIFVEEEVEYDLCMLVETMKILWLECLWVHENLYGAESPKGASFGALSRCAPDLGIVFRRVHYEAIKYEKDRNAGFISPFGFSAATVSAAVDTVCSVEWYWILALKSQVSNEGPCSVLVWRWKG